MEMVMMKVGLVLFLMGFAATATATATTVDASSLLAQAMMNSESGYKYITKYNKGACCNDCSCTVSIPPQCKCNDVGETCHSGCQSCLCTRSYPPQCRCVDTTFLCFYPPCLSSDTESAAKDH